MIGRIYLITNRVSGRCYVGQTVQTLAQRFRQHASAKGPLGCAIRKYGRDNFTVTVLEECAVALLDDAECHWISRCASRAPAGYNLMGGGQGQRHGHSPETCKRLSDALRGRRLPPETCAKMSAARTGRALTEEERGRRLGRLVHTPEARARIGAAHRGKALSAEHRARLCEARRARPGHSEQTRAKMSESATRAWACQRGKRHKTLAELVQ